MPKGHPGDTPLAFLAPPMARPAHDTAAVAWPSNSPTAGYQLFLSTVPFYHQSPIKLLSCSTPPEQAPPVTIPLTNSEKVYSVRMPVKGAQWPV